MGEQYPCKVKVCRFDPDLVHQVRNTRGMAGVNYARAIQAHIERCLIAISDQEERVRYLSLSDRHELHEIARRTLAGMYRALKTARNGQLLHHRAQRRGLNLDLMCKFAKRGQLLAALSPSELAILLREHDISASEAAACMKLYRNWRVFITAERWCYDGNEPSPTTVDEALVLLERWHQVVI